MRTTVWLAAVVMVLGLYSAPAAATSCAQTDAAEQLDRSDAVFVGTPTSSAADEDTVVVAVTDVYKGEVPSTVPVQVEPDMDVQPWAFEEDQQYVFFARGADDGALTTSVCSGTGPVDDAVLTELEAASSDRAAYRPTGPSPTPTAAVPTPVEESAAGGVTAGSGDDVVVDGSSEDVNAISPVLVGVVILALVSLVVLAPAYRRRRSRKDSVTPTP